MANVFYATIVDSGTGLPISGLSTVKLYYGANPINSATGGAYIGDMADDGNGSYFLDISSIGYNQFTIKVSGTANDEYSDVWLIGPNVASYGTLSDQLGYTGGAASGASKVGVYDGSSIFSGTNVQTILEELAGARTSPYTNQNIKWLYDKLSPINSTTAELNALNGAACSNADFVKLHAISSTAAELNKLAGATAAVTAAAISALCAAAGEVSNTYHIHDGRYYTEAEIGTSGIAQLVLGINTPTEGKIVTPTSLTDTPVDLRLKPGADTSGDKGALYFDTRATSTNADGGSIWFDTRGNGTGAWGTIKIYSNDGFYDVITEWEVGNLDFIGTQFLSTLDPSDASIITNAFKELDRRMGDLYLLQGTPATSIFYDQTYIPVRKMSSWSGTLAAAVAVASATMTSSTEVQPIKFTIDPDGSVIKTVRVKIKCKMNAGTGTLNLYIAGSVTSVATVTVTETTDTWKTLTWAITGTFSTPTEMQVGTKSDGTNTLTVYDDFQIEVGH